MTCSFEYDMILICSIVSWKKKWSCLFTRFERIPTPYANCDTFGQLSAFSKLMFNVSKFRMCQCFAINVKTIEKYLYSKFGSLLLYMFVFGHSEQFWKTWTFFGKVRTKFWKPTIFGKHEQQLEFSNMFLTSQKKLKPKRFMEFRQTFFWICEQKIECRTIFEIPNKFWKCERYLKLHGHFLNMWINVGKKCTFLSLWENSVN